MIQWFETKREDWFIKQDLTGRIALIARKKKLHRTFSLLPLERAMFYKLKSTEHNYHIFDTMNDSVDVHKFDPNAKIGTSMFPTRA